MTMTDENTSRQAEEFWRSDDWAELRWAREHSTPRQIARHLLDPQWRDRDYNALDELVEMTHAADLSSLDEDDLETLASSGLPELRQTVIRYAGTPARLLEDMARTEGNTRLLHALVESGRLGRNAIDLCCWNQTDVRLAADMLRRASDDLLRRLSGRDWWPGRKMAVESGRLDRARMADMLEKEDHPDVVSALLAAGEFDTDDAIGAIRRVITSPALAETYTNPMNRAYGLDRPRTEVVRLAARTMLEHAPVGPILRMPDDDDGNWRTLVDTAAMEYAGASTWTRSSPSPGRKATSRPGPSSQAGDSWKTRKPVRAGRGRHRREMTAPTGSTCGCSDVSGPTSTISSDRPGRRNTYGPAAWTRRSRNCANSTGPSGREAVPNGSPPSGSTGPNGR